MHMADALISPVAGTVMIAVSTGAVAYSAAKIKKDEFGEKKVPVMAVAAAFVFAAQMINFTIPATGSSGHIGGGILLAGLLGPYASLLSISVVLIIQALFFADGGLLALGCNIFNMGVIPCLVIYPVVFRPLVKKGMSAGRISAASISSVVLSLQLGAFSVVMQTLASNITELPFATFVLLMQPIHLAIGLVEGLITAAVLSFVFSVRPEILTSAERNVSIGRDVPMKKILVILAVVTVLTGGVISVFASSYPDGLEWAMENTAGTAELSAEGTLFRRAEALQETTAFMPDYDYADAGEASVNGTSVAGIIGSTLTALLAGGTGFAIYAAKKNKKKALSA